MPRKVFRPVIEEIDSPPEPLSIFKRIQHRPYSFFLDSACDRMKLGRFSFLGCDPFLTLRSKDDHVKLDRPGGSSETLRSDPFAVIRKLLKEYAVANPRKDIPFIGGAVGYLSYDLKNFIEDLPDGAKDDIDLPDCMLGFYNSVVIYDNLKKRCYVSDMGLSQGSSKDYMRAMLSASEGEDRLYHSGNRKIISSELRSNFSKSSYVAAVRKAKDYIRKGDIYQVNISQRFHANISEEISDLYARLRKVSPAPFASCLNFGEVSILSSSPERFLMKRGTYIETRPIKGTRPRGGDPKRDEAMERELKNSAKDMAEHIMIVDLERSDLGRICRYGSVRPTESAIVEKYADVFHLVSTVSGTLKKGAEAVDCLIATFPGGSITGAPKIRSMEIIDELESVKRSIYTGAIGYIGFDGNMDTSIVIRTFIVKGKDLYFQVGGGIVADSVPEKEYEETLHKAKGLMRALGIESYRESYKADSVNRKKVYA